MGRLSFEAGSRSACPRCSSTEALIAGTEGGFSNQVRITLVCTTCALQRNESVSFRGVSSSEWGSARARVVASYPYRRARASDWSELESTEEFWESCNHTVATAWKDERQRKSAQFEFESKLRSGQLRIEALTERWRGEGGLQAAEERTRLVDPGEQPFAYLYLRPICPPDGCTAGQGDHGRHIPACLTVGLSAHLVAGVGREHGLLEDGFTCVELLQHAVYRGLDVPDGARLAFLLDVPGTTPTDQLFPKDPFVHGTVGLDGGSDRDRDDAIVVALSDPSRVSRWHPASGCDCDWLTGELHDDTPFAVPQPIFHHPPGTSGSRDGFVTFKATTHQRIHWQPPGWVDPAPPTILQRCRSCKTVQPQQAGRAFTCAGDCGLVAHITVPRHLHVRPALHP